MTKRKGIRVLSMLALCALLICSFSMTAFAYADDTEQNLPVTEATQPDEMTEPETPAETLSEGEPIDDEGNAYTRDLLYDKTTNKQFITIQTKSGNTFYVVIDYDAPINEEEEQYQTYFLNMVDESDLLALMDEDSVAALTTCTCTERCEAGRVNTSCPVCKNNMSECTGTVSEPEAPAEEPEPVEDIHSSLMQRQTALTPGKKLSANVPAAAHLSMWARVTITVPARRVPSVCGRTTSSFPARKRS